MDNDFEERDSLENLLDYLEILWHWMWLILLVAIIAGAAVYFLTFQQPRVYQSSTRATVNVLSNSQSYDAYTGTIAAQRLAETYSQTMITDALLQSVEERLGTPFTGSTSVSVDDYSPVLQISVTDNDPQKAADIANAVVASFADKIMDDQAARYNDLRTSLEEEIDAIDLELIAINQKLASIQNSGSESSSAIANRSQLELERGQYQQTRSTLLTNLLQIKLAEVQTATTITQLDKAVPNPTPIQPRPWRSAALAAIIGIMITAGIILLVVFLEDEIRDPAEITRKWGVPVIGTITKFPSGEDPLITNNKPRLPVSEAFRSIRTNLQFSGINTPLKSILITSASPTDGKSSIAANLATVIAQSEKSVILIDGDLRKPTQHKLLKVSNRIGLSDLFLRPNDKVTGVVRSTVVNNLSLITSGSLPPNPSELLSSPKMSEIMLMLNKHFDYVVMDSPPLLAVTDALVMAKNADGVILVIDPNVSKRGAIRQSIEQLQRAEIRLLGVVFNNIKIKRSTYYYNRQYYYSKQYGKVTDESASEKKAKNDLPKLEAEG